MNKNKKNSFSYPVGLSALFLACFLTIMFLCFAGMLGQDPFENIAEYPFGRTSEGEYLVFLLLSSLPFFYLVFHENRIEKLSSDDKEIAIPIIAFVVFYYLFSPFQNCIREFSPNDWRGGSTPVTIKLHKSVCDSDTNW